METVDPMETCGAKTRRGTPCERTAGWGTNHPGVGRCKNHGGSSPNAERAGALQLAKREMVAMGMPLDIPPHEALLECIRISAGEVQYASDRIAELQHSQLVGPVVTTRPLKEEKGAESSYERAEEHGPPALHIWVQVRHQAMDRLVNYSKVAIAAGLSERLVKMAEQEAQALADAMKRFAVAMGHDPADPKVREALRGSLTLIQGGKAA